jgi:hypothetical protein
MRTAFSVAVTLGILMLGIGSAQELAPGSYGPGHGLGGPVVLLRTKSVQKELKATPEQARKLDELSEDMKWKGLAASKKLQEVPPENRRAKALEQARTRQEALPNELAKILEPGQTKRFMQIYIQQLSVLAFELPHVQQALKLTDDQKAQFELINRELRDSLRTPPGDLPKEPRDPTGKSLAARAQALAKCIAALTDEQKMTWNDLYGEPFVIVVERSPK